MSGIVPEDCEAVYAAVDKTNKKKCPEIAVNSSLPDSTIPMYAILNRKKKTTTPNYLTDKNKVMYSNTDKLESAVYSNINVYDLPSMADEPYSGRTSPEGSQPKEQLRLFVSNNANKVDCNDANKVESNKNNSTPSKSNVITCICQIALFLMVAIFLVALALAIWAAFSEISILQSDMKNSTEDGNIVLEKLSIAFIEISRLQSEIIHASMTLAEILQLQSQKCNVTRNTLNCSQNIEPEFLNETGFAFTSCSAILNLSPSSPSGNYVLRSSNGSVMTAYCDMTRSCGGITGGWTRVVQLDMTDANTVCPSSLKRFIHRRRTCVIGEYGSQFCTSDTFAVKDVPYSKVCGRIIGYQVGGPDGFGASDDVSNSSNHTNQKDIDDFYMDGVSLTHGNSPRQHIWTFAAVQNEESMNSGCPCINSSINSTSPPPLFVGDDYFCDTADFDGSIDTFQEDDPLWDGEGCGLQNTCCSFNNPPWFYRELPQSTTDDIEMRVCRDEERDDEDIAIEVVEIYVQ